MIYVKLALITFFSLLAITLLCYGIWREEELVQWEQKTMQKVSCYGKAFVLYIKKHGIKHFLKMVAVAVLEELREPLEEPKTDRVSNVVVLEKANKR